MDHDLVISKNQKLIQSFIEEFLMQFISDETKRAYLKDLIYFFSFLSDQKMNINHPGQLQPTHMQLYRDFLIGQKFSSATINRRLVVLRSFAKWGVSLKLIDVNPFDALKLPRVQTEEPTLAFTDEEVQHILQVADGKDSSEFKIFSHRLLLLFLFHLGLRRDEARNLKWSDVYQDGKHQVIKIRGKGNKIRELPISDYLKNELSLYQKISLEKWGKDILQSYIIQLHEKHLSPKPINGATIYRILVKYARLAGITRRISPHSCRATSISHLLDTAKVNIRDVAIFAGHSLISTTERYDKRRKSLDHSAAYAIDFDHTKKKTKAS